MSYTPCPSCGVRFDQGSAIRWSRLLYPPDLRPVTPFNVPIPDYATPVTYSCPACRFSQCFPLDGPHATA
ncbi:MAG: hypothetical protein HY901_08000 [Deltaproteobacteria bacterium]|nr:hypothetical protein [Deltaproteobacteria bacterium]